MKTLVKVLSYIEKRTNTYCDYHTIIAVLAKRPAANKCLNSMAKETAKEEGDIDPKCRVKVSRTFVVQSTDFPRYERNILQSYGALVYNTLGGTEYEIEPPYDFDCSCSGCGDPDCNCGYSPNLKDAK